MSLSNKPLMMSHQYTIHYWPWPLKLTLSKYMIESQLGKLTYCWYKRRSKCIICISKHNISFSNFTVTNQKQLQHKIKWWIRHITCLYHTSLMLTRTELWHALFLVGFTYLFQLHVFFLSLENAFKTQSQIVWILKKMQKCSSECYKDDWIRRGHW